ncbi:MAG: type I glyceraldehyde-3-phosphate dehydrogenase [Alphaproteobacteria bacterium]|nr:type I glyceraldehyde-3-phosphate dehydrogenase [Alphaproteobacteria bacterium]
MALRIAINGFGRIGRNVLRSAWNRDDVEFVHINDLTSDDMLAYLLRRDTVHGTWGVDVEVGDEALMIGGKRVPVTAERDPTKLPWGDLGVDVVLECTGVFTKREKAGLHLQAGAKKVIISAPADDADKTFVYGVNHHEYEPSKHHVVSNASCTTNCLAPVAKAIHDSIGIEHGLVTTVHSYTMDQNILDAPHKKDFRRARAAAQNIVPTSTGAAKAIGLVMPELKGKMDGMAIRVPTPNVSLVDLVFKSSRATSAAEVNEAIVAAANGKLKGVLAATNEPIVSSDLIGNPHSSIADLGITKVIADDCVKVLSWYDNEWGFSCRMIDLAKVVAG